jgi:5-(carboxyamino)imidazole ribonucleotide synthase
MRILILGAGQLARMMALSGEAMGLECYAYDIENQKVVDPIYHHPHQGTLSEWIEKADIITAEFEHIANDILQLCEDSGKLKPNQHAIKIGGDRCKEKTLLDELSIPNASYVTLKTSQDLDIALARLHWPLILKTAKGGYDGKGQWRLNTPEQANALKIELDTFFHANPDQMIIAEQCIPFEQEVSIIGARNAFGEITTYPITINQHNNGVLVLSIVEQENHPLQQEANAIFERLTTHLNYIGVLAIEFFVWENQLLVNEIAPRVHNSGHWTQLGSTTCQFTQHLRAITEKRLCKTTWIAPTAMINVLGCTHLPEILWQFDSSQPHWYQKTPRIGRKMGHINLQAPTIEALNNIILQFKAHTKHELPYL